jgi:predicted phage gp36 major capsid-like protein
VQPTIFAQQWRAFVPFSIELANDWAGIQQELVRLVADARDVLEATKFYNGSGTNEPFGVQTSLTTSQRVQSAGAGAFAIADVYTFKQALPTAVTTGAKIGLYGDFKAGYQIADRLGITAELIPHLFGATDRFPTGQRGRYVYGRTGANVVVANALRYLETR